MFCNHIEKIGDIDFEKNGGELIYQAIIDWFT